MTDAEKTVREAFRRIDMECNVLLLTIPKLDGISADEKKRMSFEVKAARRRGRVAANGEND
jgi:hypothetical protein